MKYSVNILKFTLIALILLMSAFALYGCEEKQEFLQSKEINGLEEAKNNSALEIEWLDDYDRTKPVLVVFHGEVEKDEYFQINLSCSAYDDSITFFSDRINKNTIGLKGNGLKKTEDGNYYDMETYWVGNETINVGDFNVAIFHSEKFYQEEINDSITKIYSFYKSRYNYKGVTYEANFGHSLTEVASIILKEEFDKVNLGKNEIRFLGNGIGALLAQSVAWYLYEANDKNLISGYLPSRVTICDAYLSNEELYFSTDFDGISAKEGTIGIVSALAKKLAESGVANEIIESAYVNNNEIKYPYANNVRDGTKYNLYKENSAYLFLSQKYTNKDCYYSYLNKNRVALDWYIYSIIGSDDSYEWDSSSQKYAIGYPHKYSEVSSVTKGTCNWGTNGRRPILNNRKVTNDAKYDSGENYGKNFGIGAWTPTPYIYALKGMEFTLMEAGEVTENTDVHGNAIYQYSDYVMQSFRSENYQYSDLKKTTVLSGRVYYDENGDGIMNDGANNGHKSTLFLSVETNSGKEILARRKINTDNNGFYNIILKDADTINDVMVFEPNESGGIFTGFSTQKEMIIVKLELFTPKGFTSSQTNSSGLWYEIVTRNNFNKGSVTISLSKYNTHSAIINNCIINSVE